MTALPRCWALASVCAAALLLQACSRTEAVPEPLRAVKLLTVAPGTQGARLEYAGEVRARVESRLGFRVGGKIVSRSVEPGQHVEAGQVLARLDARDLGLSTDAARAQVAAATTQRDLAAADVRRYAALKSENFISGAELERREAALKSAQASLDQAQAQLAAQSNQASYAQLLADAAGVVTGIDAEPGQVVGAGTPVVRLAKDGPRDAVFAVPEDRRASLSLGQDVNVSFWAAEAEPVMGRVREIAASADPVTRTYQVKVALPEQGAPALGATVRARPVDGQSAPALIKLPLSALRQHGGEGQGTAVWLFDAASSSVRLQPVELGPADGNEVVVLSGLEPGMQVVATGVHVLNPGQKVGIYQDKYQKNTPAAQQGQTQPAPEKEAAVEKAAP